MNLITLALCLLFTQFSEGMLSNSNNVKKIFSNPDCKYAKYELENALGEDLITEYLKSSIKLNIPSTGNDTKLDSMMIYLNREQFAWVLQFKADNYLEHYIKLLASIKDGNDFETERIIEEMNKYSKPEIDSLLNMAKAILLMKKNDYNNALLLINSYNDSYSLYIKSICYLKKGDYDTAYNILKQINNHTINHSGYIIISDIYMKKEQYSEALNYIRNFEEEFKQSDKMSYILYQKGYIYYKKGYFLRSIDILENMISISRNNTLKGNAYYLIGKNYFMLGDYEHMEKYLAYVKSPLIPSDFKKNALFLDSKGMFFGEDYEKAIEKMEKFIELYSEDFLTPYAYQILAQSYFYLGDLSKSLKYINSIENPEFIVDKLVLMKYFIDYRNGIFEDSISAHESFLNNEKSNPLRKDAYEYILNHSDNDDLKTGTMKLYLEEFPDNNDFIHYFSNLMPYLVFYERHDDILWFADRISEYLPKSKDALYTMIIEKMYELGMNRKAIEFYARYADKYDKDDDKIIFHIAELLSKTDEKKASELLMQHLIDNSSSMYVDSAYVLLSEIYIEERNLINMRKLLSEINISEKHYLYAFILRNKAQLEKINRNYEYAVNDLIMSAEIFGDKRDEASISLIKAAEAAYENKDTEYACILLDKASILAMDIEIINRIKVLNDKYKDH